MSKSLQFLLPLLIIWVVLLIFVIANTSGLKQAERARPNVKMLQYIHIGMRRAFANADLSAFNRQPGGLTAAANMKYVFQYPMNHENRSANARLTNQWGSSVIPTVTGHQHYTISESAPGREACVDVVRVASYAFSNITVSGFEVNAGGTTNAAGRYVKGHMAHHRLTAASRKFAITYVTFDASIHEVTAPSAHKP